MVLIKYILANISVKEKVELFKRLYEEVAGMGINGDTELAHINKEEGAILKMMGGSGTINEETGLMQYFGGSPPPPPAASSTVTQQQTIPEEMKPYITDVLTQSQALNKQRTEEGYQPYQGAQIAEFQPEQTQAQTGIAGLVGSGQPYFDKAEALTQQAGQAPTAETMQSYMSPYMQNVVDIQKREALRQGDVAAQGQAMGAVQAGAFGGSRDAIVQAEQQRNLATQLGDIQAKGSAAAYADAQQQYAAQQKNALAAGAQFGALATGVPGQAMKEFGALESVGAAKQQQEQQALNIAKQQFIQEQTFPEANLQQYSSIIRGYNLPPNTYQTAQTTTPAPSYMQQIAGLGMAGAGIAGAFSGFKGAKEGGLVGLAKGGKVLRRAEGGRTQVDILSELPDDKLREMADNPEFSRTLVDQEISRRPSLNKLGSFSDRKQPSLRNLVDQQSLEETSADTAARADTPEGYREQLINAATLPLGMTMASPLKHVGRSAIGSLSSRAGLASLGSGKVAGQGISYRALEGSGRAGKRLTQAEVDIGREAGRGLAASAPSGAVIAGTDVVDKVHSVLGDEKETSPDREKALDELYADLGVGSKTPKVQAPEKANEPQILLGTPEKGQEGVPLLKDKGNAITSQYTNVPMDALKQLTEKKDALAEQSPNTAGIANDIYSDAISKLQASTDKKKSAMSDRAAGLDQAKWLAVADMGFQMMAAPGGATFIQALGGAAGKSGIAGKLASLNDKQKEMAFNLAEMDEKQVMSTFGISQAKAAASVEHAKLEGMWAELSIKAEHENNVELKTRLEAVRDRVKAQLDIYTADSRRMAAQASVDRANKEPAPKALSKLDKDTEAMFTSMFKTKWENVPKSVSEERGALWNSSTEKRYIGPVLARAHDYTQRKGMTPDTALVKAFDEIVPKSPAP